MYNWALIGYGGMGGWHVRKLLTLPEIKVAGVYDILPERNAAAEAEGVRAYPSLEALLSDKDVNFVTIATPNDTHLPLVVEALAAGKHVICEKPVALSLAELQTMIDASRRCGRLFCSHQNRRWDEDYLIIKKIFKDDELGGVFNIESRVHGSRGVPSDWRNEIAHGGGMILDWGVHLIDQVLLLTDEPVVSTWCGVTHVTNDEVDDGFKTVITFGSGLTALVEVGTSNFVSMPRWYMQGRNGTTVIEDWELNGKTVMVSDWHKRDAVPVATAAGLTKTMAPRTEETIKNYPLPRIESDVCDFYRNFLSAMAGEAQLIVKHAEMLRVMKLLEAMKESARLDQVVHTRI
ncbi:MAG: Gfo/Idh/MocA family oxidoreductase [Clostridiales bacterium]|jgi:predicted dehydrogenase|nr:Gfo/Idh/MocA family oxidoreductase [Clostridiales bacterium]